MDGVRWRAHSPSVTAKCRLQLFHLAERLGPPMEEWWNDLGSPRLTPELRERAVAGVEQELADVDREALTAARDRVLLDLLAAKASARELP